MFGLFGGDDDGFSDARDNLERNRLLYQQIALPEYEQLTPELYDNESYNYQLLSEDPVVKSKQLETLARFSDLSNEGLSEADDAAFFKAKQLGDQVAKSKREAAVQDAQVRGVGGSGMEFAMREAGNQEASQRAQEAAMAQAAARANQRSQYLQAYANQLGNTRDQDYRTNAANTNVINQFNQMNTQARNQTNANNVDKRQEAWMYNQGLQDKNFANQNARADRMAGMNNQATQISAAEAEQKRRRGAAMTGLVGAGIGAAVGGGAGAGVGYQMGNALY